MIIYSVMPMERIMENIEETKYNYRELEVEGIQMLVEQIPNTSEAKIVRLMSPDPQHYLNPRYMPGQKIYFRPDARLS